MPEKPKEIRIEMPTSVYHAANLRDLVFAVAHNVGQFSEHWAYRLQAVVDELCNNAIEHGSAKDGLLRVILQVVPKVKLAIIVEDAGQGPTQATAAELNKHVADLSEGEETAPAKISTSLRGRGLTKIVKAWTDEIRFEDRAEGGIRAIASKQVAAAEQEEKTATVTGAAHLDTITQISFR